MRARWQSMSVVPLESFMYPTTLSGRTLGSASPTEVRDRAGLEADKVLRRAMKSIFWRIRLFSCSISLVRMTAAEGRPATALRRGGSCRGWR